MFTVLNGLEIVWANRPHTYIRLWYESGSTDRKIVVQFNFVFMVLNKEFCTYFIIPGLLTALPPREGVANPLA